MNALHKYLKNPILPAKPGLYKSGFPGSYIMKKFQFTLLVKDTGHLAKKERSLEC